MRRKRGYSYLCEFLFHVPGKPIARRKVGLSLFTAKSKPSYNST